LLDLKKYFSGILICLIIGLATHFIYHFFALKILDPMITALIIGIIVRVVKSNLGSLGIGITWSGKSLLEFAVMLMGANIAINEIFESGFSLLIIILLAVSIGMLVSYFVGHKLLGLDKKVSTLIGVGNSICGNSAVVAVAPVIGALPSQIAAVIGFSAILGTLQIILLPLFFSNFGISNYDYGVIAGISVYAVSQVVAASSIVSDFSTKVATTVKLTRVLLLGPLVVLLGIIFRSNNENIEKDTEKKLKFNFFSIKKYFPWFVIGFIFLTIFRSVGLINSNFGQGIFDFGKIIMAISMVAIGISVDLKEIVKLGPKVAITISSVMLVMISIGLLGIFII